MVDFTQILFGLIAQKYFYLIVPISLLIIGFAIKKRAGDKDIYVGRITMFSNSAALLSFYPFIQNPSLLVISIINISVILGVIGIISYVKVNHHLSNLHYYRFTRWFDSIYVGLFIIIYSFFPNLFL